MWFLLFLTSLLLCGHMCTRILTSLLIQPQQVRLKQLDLQHTFSDVMVGCIGMHTLLSTLNLLPCALLLYSLLSFSLLAPTLCCSALLYHPLPCLPPPAFIHCSLVTLLTSFPIDLSPCSFAILVPSLPHITPLLHAIGTMATLCKCIHVWIFLHGLSNCVRGCQSLFDPDADIGQVEHWVVLGYTPSFCLFCPVVFGLYLCRKVLYLPCLLQWPTVCPVHSWRVKVPTEKFNFSVF